jgi:hypothetical protein
MITPTEGTGSDTTSTREKLNQLNTIVKPARASKLRLHHTLCEEKKEYLMEYIAFKFEIPQWVYARLLESSKSQIVDDWMTNARFLEDPAYGEFTRARFLAKWEKVMSCKEQWMNRDKSLTVKISIEIPEGLVSRIRAVTEFLNVSREVLFVGILAHEALTRFSDKGPIWDDMTMLVAGQNAGGAQ